MIILKPILHDKIERILLQYEYNSTLNKIVKTIPDIKWSASFKCWHIPLDEAAYKTAEKILKPHTQLDTKLLGAYLLKRKKVAITMPAAAQSAAKTAATASAWKLSKENLLALEKFVEQLKLKAYSPATIRTYRNEFLQLLQLLKNKAVNELTPDDLKRYMVYAMEKEGIKENTVHSRLNALKFYFEQVLKREKFFWEIPRPKKPMLLPRFFNGNEIAAIINSTKNLKHKTMLMLCYSMGLRVSEVVRLRTWNIDSKRMCVLIEQAKGKKDRFAPLSPVLLVMLRKYAAEYKPAIKGFLFEGQSKGTSYSERSLQEVLQAAKQKAHILKPGGMHALRHSFATHLLDKGTDISMIQKLLGHNDIKTTLRYLHTTNKDILNIISPLDSLSLKL